MEGTPGVHPFQLADAKGQLHNYVVQEHPAGEGQEIMWELFGLGVPTALGLAGAALKLENIVTGFVEVLREGTAEPAEELVVGEDGQPLEQAAEVPAGPSKTEEFARLFVGLDLSAVGLELGKAIGSGKFPKLTQRLLSRTFRDGKPVSQVFNQAYQANYGEMILALWKVCQYNNFFPLPSILASVSPEEAAAQTTPPPAT